MSPSSPAEPPLPSWSVYVLISQTTSRTYVGIALDVGRRLAQHNGEQRGGARSTRAGRPWQVATCYGPYPSRGEALRAELRIKRLRGLARLDASEPRAQPPNAVSSSPAG